MAATTLQSALDDYGPEAWLITVGEDGPHTSNVMAELRGETVTCALGNSARRNVVTRPNVSLLWPSREPGGYGIILNGRAEIEGERNGSAIARIVLTKSVFHRPGPKPEGGTGPCQSDCVALTRS